LNPIQQGLYVSGVGLLVLFAVSAIFYLVLVGMQKLFPVKEEGEEIKDQAPAAQTVAVSAKSSDEKAIVAVVAVALSLAQSQIIPGLGDSLQNNRGAWWSAKLVAAHKNTIIKRK
jgi:Na+-transporting methylmalonyl-CoA/oxaloacetate decarboxylase gamma subunit